MRSSPITLHSRSNYGCPNGMRDRENKKAQHASAAQLSSTLNKDDTLKSKLEFGENFFIEKDKHRNGVLINTSAYGTNILSSHTNKTPNLNS